MDAIAQVSTINYGFPKVVGPVSLGSFKNKLISLQWSLGTRGTEQSSQQRCFFNQLELLAIVQDSTQSSPHCWATTLTSQWEILFEQGLHDLTQLKSFFFFAYGVFCRLVQVYLTFCVWPLKVFCLWPPKHPGSLPSLGFSPIPVWVLRVSTASLRSAQCSVWPRCRHEHHSKIVFSFCCTSSAIPSVGDPAASWLLVMSLDFSSVPSGTGNFVCINLHVAAGFTGTKQKFKIKNKQE